MSKTYPRIQYRQASKHGLCVCCQIRTADKTSIEHSHMRGDDEWVFVCRGHKADEVLAAVVVKKRAQAIQFADNPDTSEGGDND